MFFLLSLLTSFKKSPAEKAPISPTPTIIQPIVQGGPGKGIFDSKNFRTFLNISKNRPSLSSKDSAIRQNLIISMGNTTGILYEDNDIQIAYLKSANDFEVEIKTNDVSAAQQKAVSYFAAKGLSVDGLCKLPVFFFASPSVFQYLKSNGQTLDATPFFCENL
jgi:hypothetical protein